MGIIVGFTIVERIKLKRIRIISMVELLKSSYLNLNNCEVTQENMEVMLLDSLQ
jgi:hypothetical protein